MNRLRCSRSVRVCAGVLAGVLLHCVAGWWSSPAFAQSSSTTTTSTSSSTSFESPPACRPVGSSRIVLTVTLEDTIGPGTIIIGDRDNGGTAFDVLSGTNNLNVNLHTATFQCIAAVAVAAPVPALAWPSLIGIALALGGFGAWGLARRRHEQAL